MGYTEHCNRNTCPCLNIYDTAIMYIKYDKTSPNPTMGPTLNGLIRELVCPRS